MLCNGAHYKGVLCIPHTHALNTRKVRMRDARGNVSHAALPPRLGITQGMASHGGECMYARSRRFYKCAVVNLRRCARSEIGLLPLLICGSGPLPTQAGRCEINGSFTPCNRSSSSWPELHSPPDWRKVSPTRASRAPDAQHLPRPID